MKVVEVIEKLRALADPQKAEHSKRFFKTGAGEYGEGDLFFGITVPEQRKIAGAFRALSLDEVEILLQHPVHEVRLTALFILRAKAESGQMESPEEVAQLYLRNLDFVNNWDLVDSSAPYILGPYLHQKKKDILYEFARSEDLWRRRISIITCFYFIRQNEFDDALAICELLLDDQHDLIHKATGWMLREIGNRDLDSETAFLNKHCKNMPGTMLRYAIEKFEEPLRQKYLKRKV